MSCDTTNPLNTARDTLSHLFTKYFCRKTWRLKDLTWLKPMHTCWCDQSGHLFYLHKYVGHTCVMLGPGWCSASSIVVPISIALSKTSCWPAMLYLTCTCLDSPICKSAQRWGPISICLVPGGEYRSRQIGVWEGLSRLPTEKQARRLGHRHGGSDAPILQLDWFSATPRNRTHQYSESRRSKIAPGSEL